MSDKFVKCYWNHKYIRTVKIIPGALYRIDQANPAAKKLRGEKVVLVSSGFMGKVKCLRIESKWHVRRRSYTDIDPCDLVLLSENVDWREVGIDEPDFGDHS